MSFFTKKSKYPVGLDFSDFSLKLIQLSKKGKDSIDVQAVSRVELPKGAIENGEIIDRTKVIESIKILFDKPLKGKISSREVVACLPETKTYLKLLRIEKSVNNINQIIESEVENNIPLPLNEIYFDWQIIETTKTESLILIGACSRNTVNQYIDIIKDAKLSVVALEIEAVAISRSLLEEESLRLKKEDGKNNYLIIDIGKNRTSMFVYSKNTPLFTLSLPMSGDLVTNKIAQSLEIDRAQAEKAKIICGLDKNKAKGIIRNILSDTINNIIEKINESINYYNNHFSERGEINQILICGGGSSIKNLSSYIEEAVSIKTSNGDSLTNLRLKNIDTQNIFIESYKMKTDFSDTNDSKNITMTQDNKLTYTTAIGLALKDIFNYKK